MNTPQNKNCPGCGNPSTRLVPYPEGDIRICGQCRLQWGHVDKSASGGFVATENIHYLDPASLGDPYAYAPYIDFFARLERLHGPGTKRILDVGCGGGGFVMHSLERGHDAWGVEANTALRKFLSPEALKRVHFGLAEDFPCQGEQFDVITFWDSFEHIECSFDILDRLAALLKPGGIVFMRVNNTWDVYNLTSLALLSLAPPLGRKLLKSCFNFPDHCWNFSRQAMRAMLGRRGWRIIDEQVSETPANRLTPSPVFQAAIRAAYCLNALLGGGKIASYFVRPGNP